MLTLRRIVASHAVAKRQTPTGIEKVPGKIVVDLEDGPGGFVTRLLLTKEEAAQLPVDADLCITFEALGGNEQAAAAAGAGVGGRQSAPNGGADADAASDLVQGGSVAAGVDKVTQ